MKRNILAVGAHPDDIEIGCGGALAKHLELGDEVFILIMTNGEKGTHTLDKKECLKSMNILGIKKSNIFFGNFRDGYLSDDIEVVSFIERLIKKFKINRVYTHNIKDRHQDHRNCSLATSSAAKGIAEILFFEGPSTHVDFQPHYFIELSEENLRKKLSSLESYRTQISKGIVNIEWIKSLLRVNGKQSNSEFCEAFEINHIVKKSKEI